MNIQRDILWSFFAQDQNVLHELHKSEKQQEIKARQPHYHRRKKGQFRDGYGEQITHRQCKALMVNRYHGKLVILRCPDLVCSGSILSTASFCVAKKCHENKVRIRRSRCKMPLFCAFHLNMQTISRGLYKHAELCENDVVTGLFWRCIVAYIFYGKVIDRIHREFIRGEPPANYNIVETLYHELRSKFDREKIRQFLVGLFPDENQRYLILDKCERRICDKIQWKISFLYQPDFDLLELVDEC
jgi:hypothetical protein